MLSLHHKPTQLESGGQGPGICIFDKLPTCFQCPSKMEKHWPQVMQQFRDTRVQNSNRLKLKIGSNETLGHL